MAKDKRQTELDFAGSEADRAIEFRAALTNLRDKLGRVCPDAVGLSGRRWQQVRELIMAIKCYEIAGRQPELERLMRTSGLSRDQWKVARHTALALGLVVAARQYVGRTRAADRLTVHEAAIDDLARARGPTNSPPTPLQLPCNSPPARRGDTSYPRAPAGAAKELPNNLSSSSSSARERAELEEAEEANLETNSWPAARPIANRLLRILAPRGLAALDPERRAWVARVAVLAVEFGPEWIEPVFEHFRFASARSPQGLIAKLLDDECVRRATRFNRELARVKLPRNLALRLGLP